MVEPRCGEGIWGRLGDASAAESNPHSATTHAAVPPTSASPGYCRMVPIGEDHGAATVADCDGPRVASVLVGGRLEVADHRAAQSQQALPATAPRDEERIVKVYFSLDRSGRVMDSHIISSSGSSALDEEALALVRRSEPFPATPQELKDRVNLTLPDPFRSTISITKAPTPILPGPVSTK
jgi:TonB family protein